MAPPRDDVGGGDKRRKWQKTRASDMEDGDRGHTMLTLATFVLCHIAACCLLSNNDDDATDAGQVYLHRCQSSYGPSCSI